MRRPGRRGRLQARRGGSPSSDGSCAPWPPRRAEDAPDPAHRARDADARRSHRGRVDLNNGPRQAIKYKHRYRLVISYSVSPRDKESEVMFAEEPH
jgi:hypothetical protein